jgi:hypothetical protein
MTMIRGEEMNKKKKTTTTNETFVVSSSVMKENDDKVDSMSHTNGMNCNDDYTLYTQSLPNEVSSAIRLRHPLIAWTQVDPTIPSKIMKDFVVPGYCDPIKRVI